jgi:hypothetical protein
VILNILVDILVISIVAWLAYREPSIRASYDE